MPSQTIAITDTLDDGYDNGSWNSGAPNYFSSSATSGWTFRLTTDIPAGATIDKCYFRAFRLTTTDAGTNTPSLKLENADPASNTRWSGTHLPSGATFLTAAGAASFAFADFSNVWMFGELDNRPINLTSQMQSLATSYGAMSAGEIINVAYAATAGSGYGEVEDYAAAGTNHPELYIEWTAAGGGTAALSGSALTTGHGTSAPVFAIGL